MGPYVLEFYCAKANLAIEIDGISHDMADRPRRDERRDLWLKKHGVTVVRIPAAELIHANDDAADAIVRLASEQLRVRGPLHRPSGNPPPPLRGDG